MPDSIFVNPSAVGAGAAVIKVGGQCYSKVGNSTLPFNTSSVDATYDNCDDCLDPDCICPIDLPHTVYISGRAWSYGSGMPVGTSAPFRIALAKQDGCYYLLIEPTAVGDFFDITNSALAFRSTFGDGCPDCHWSLNIYASPYNGAAGAVHCGGIPFGSEYTINNSGFVILYDIVVSE